MKIVSFTGHRDISSEMLSGRLYKILEKMIENGADTFCAGGAVGFDMLAAKTVIELRRIYPWIILVLVLPCPPQIQSANFGADDMEEYYKILRAADRTEIIAETYTRECMKKRNQRLIDLADVCVCCYDIRRTKTGTGQTVRMAEKKGIEIINLNGTSKNRFE